MSRPNILIVDDDAAAVTSLVKALSATGLEVSLHAATRAADALVLATKLNPQVCVLDLCLDVRQGVDSGFELLSALKRNDPAIRIIILTGHGTSDHGVRALSLGAASFLEKPADIPHLAALINDGIRQSELRRLILANRKSPLERFEESICAHSDVMKSVLEKLMQASQTSQSVFLNGETGTGKSLCARLIHQGSKRASHPFVRYQPTHTNPDFVNADLYGHTKGAYSGADTARQGLLLEAHRGTLFLDEVDSFPLASQVSFLGVLQERRFRPVGSNQELESDFRLISATNIDPKVAIESGKFRQDLYFRIAHLAITLPPLRERREDLPHLSRHFLTKLAEREELSVLDASPAALKLLEREPFPGNIRELEFRLENAAYRASFDNRSAIEPEDLSTESNTSSTNAQLSSDMNLLDRVEAYKLDLIKKALEKTSGNVSEAARILGVDRIIIRRALERAKMTSTAS